MKKEQRKDLLYSKIDNIVNLANDLAERASNDSTCQGLIYQLDRLILNLKKIGKGGKGGK